MKGNLLKNALQCSEHVGSFLVLSLTSWRWWSSSDICYFLYEVLAEPYHNSVSLISLRCTKNSEQLKTSKHIINSSDHKSPHSCRQNCRKKSNVFSIWIQHLKDSHINTKHMRYFTTRLSQLSHPLKIVLWKCYFFSAYYGNRYTQRA